MNGPLTYTENLACQRVTADLLAQKFAAMAMAEAAPELKEACWEASEAYRELCRQYDDIGAELVQRGPSPKLGEMARRANEHLKVIDDALLDLMNADKTAEVDKGSDEH